MIFDVFLEMKSDSKAMVKLFWICGRGVLRNSPSFFSDVITAGTVYTSFVLPILDYCDTVWSCCGSVNTDKLEKLQRRAARIIMHLGSSEKALNFLGYVTLEKRRKSHVCNLVKKCLSNRCPQFFMNYFNYNRDILPRKDKEQ